MFYRQQIDYTGGAAQRRQWIQSGSQNLCWSRAVQHMPRVFSEVRFVVWYCTLLTLLSL